MVVKRLSRLLTVGALCVVLSLSLDSNIQLNQDNNMTTDRPIPVSPPPSLWFAIYISPAKVEIAIHEGYLEAISDCIESIPQAKYMTEEAKQQQIRSLTTVKRLGYHTRASAGFEQVEIVWRKQFDYWGNHSIVQKDWIDETYKSLEWKQKMVSKLIRKIARIAGAEGTIKPRDCAYRLNGVEGISAALRALQALKVTPTRVIVLPGASVGHQVKCTWGEIHDLTFEARHPHAKVGA